MPNAIKYNTSAESLALKKGNFWIGTGDVGKGTTAATGFYNGIAPPNGGYTIYVNKASGGPQIYTATNDAGLITLTNIIAGASYTTANECFNYYNGQTDKMVVNRDYESIVTNGLILNLDAGFVPSYPKNGTTLYDISGSGNNATIFNSPSYSSNNGGILQFNGSNQGGYTNSTINFAGSFSVGMWIYIKSWKFIDCPCSGVGNGVLSGILDASDGYWNMWAFQTTTPSLDFFTFYNTSYNGVSIGLGGSLNTWAYYVVSYNHLGNAIGYRNGSQVASQAVTGQITPNVNLYFNYYSRHCGSCWSNNDTACIQIYNRAISSDEVSTNYNAMKSRFGL